MVAGAAALEGTHPLTAFRGVGSAERTTICTLRRANVAHSGDMLIFKFEADRFLRHMVRMIVGTLLKVGAGKLAAEAVAEILAGENNPRAGPRAPAQWPDLLRGMYPHQPS